MGKTTITDDMTTQLFINDPGDWVIAKEASIRTTGMNAIAMGNSADYDHLKVLGAVESVPNGLNIAGIDVDDDHLHVTIGESGTVKGYYGISGSNIADFTLENSGKVLGSTYGYYFYSVDGMKALNAGTIFGDTAGVKMSGSDVALINEGRIASGMTGVNLSADALSTATFTNRGNVDAPAAFVGGKNSEVVINHGKLDGNVLLLDGGDTFDFGSGKVGGSVYGGGGDDTFIIRKNAAAIVEHFSEGSDTIKSFVSHAMEANIEKLLLLGGKDINGIGNSDGNVINAGRGDNVLKGLEGADHLNGGAGNDTLTGCVGQDYFLFGDKSGFDIITDFDTEGTDHDFIDVSLLDGFNTLADLTPLMKQVGDGVRINFGDGNRVIIENVDLGELSQDHFMF